MRERTPEQLLLLLEGQSRILERIAQAAPLPGILDDLTRVVEQQAEGMLCSVLLLSTDRRHVLHGAAPSLPDRYNRAVDGAEIGARAGSCGTAAFLRKQVIVTDIEHDPLWADWKDVALDVGLRACWSTPIFSGTGEVLGTFAMYYRQAASPSPMHLELIELATHLARVAIERDLADRERQRLVNDLDTKKAHLQSVIDQMPISVTIADQAGRLVAFNKRVELDFGHSPIPSQSIEHYGAWKILDRDGQPADPERLPVARALRHGETVTSEEFVTVRGDGTRATMSLGGAPLRASDGRIEGAVGVAWNITQQKELEEALRGASRELDAANRHKDQFIAMLAHELRNPLGAISNAIHVVRLRLARGEEVDGPLAVAERQVGNSSRLLDDLLDVAMLTRGVIQLRKEQTRLDAVVAAAVEAQRSSIESRGHRLEVLVPEEPTIVEGDPTRLEQVLSNLLDNAAKYTPDGGDILLCLERGDREAILRVRDSGLGISAEFLPRIFDLFVQADRSLARTQGGLGLGLGLVKSLIAMHGGTVEARSEGLGMGSEFVVRIPLAAEVREAARTGGSAASAADVSRRVLVVEDNADAAELLAEVLGSAGHTVEVAHDGPSAVSVAGRFEPEIALIDIGLPGMDGYEVARRLRAESKGRAPVLVALTGYGQEDDQRRSLDAGMAVHLTKPFDLGELERIIQRLSAAAEGAPDRAT